MLIYSEIIEVRCVNKHPFIHLLGQYISNKTNIFFVRWCARARCYCECIWHANFGYKLAGELGTMLVNFCSVRLLYRLPLPLISLRVYTTRSGLRVLAATRACRTTWAGAHSRPARRSGATPRRYLGAPHNRPLEHCGRARPL